MDILYFDHAASSWPKPPQVAQRMVEAVEQYGANPGRGSHRMALQASRVLLQARMAIATLFHIDNPNDVCFTSGTTMALNLAIKGMVEAGDHVITTALEHNSVRRPLEFLRRQGLITVTYLPASEEGEIDLQQLVAAIRPETKMFVASHSSNLLGSILPAAEIGQILSEHSICYVLDAAQTAGHYPIDVQAMKVDMLAFAGHKGLLGPQGIGGLYIAPHLDVQPLLHGGSGANSADIDQPAVRPERYEAGTQNTPGIAGLYAGVSYLLEQGVEQIYEQQQYLIHYLCEGLSQIEGVRVLGPDRGKPRTGIASFVHDQLEASEVAFQLDREYGIAVRAGMHCTPLSHQTANTLDSGAVRASIGCYTTEADINRLLEAVRAIVQRNS